MHYFSQLIFWHLPVANANLGFWHQVAQVVINRWDGLDAVVHEKDLSAAV